MTIHPYELTLTRAHRRFLGLAFPLRVPGTSSPELMYEPLADVRISAFLREFFLAHLAGAGQTQGGVLFGLKTLESLYVQNVLPGGYGLRGDPFLLDGQYVLGAVEALRQGAGIALDWVGNWVIEADGLITDELADQRLWKAARAKALVSDEHVLLIVGRHEERLVIKAFSEDEGQPRQLKVIWE